MPFLQRAKKIGRRFQNPVQTGVGGFKTIWKALPQLLFNKEQKVPRRSLGPFFTDASAYATAPASGLRITWMGHSAMLMEIDGLRVLIDPVWDRRAAPVQWAGPKRFFAAPLPLDQLPEIDVVLQSHDHYDHLGRGTIERLSRLDTLAGARWITSLEVGKILQSFGVKADSIAELDWTESVDVGGRNGGSLKITALPARHFSGRGLANRFETLWSSWILKGAGNNGQSHNIYFGADSGWWEGFTEIGAAYGPFDLTMLEIGAFNELWKDIHMGPDGAAKAFEDMGSAGLLMPIHWGLFDLALHTWTQPIERMLDIAEERRIKLWSPQPGLPTEVVRGRELRSDWWR